MAQPISNKTKNAVAQVRNLLAQVETILQNPNDCPESAVWRLVDAAGIVYEDLVASENQDNLIGVDLATGRGYRLEVKGS